MLLEKTKKEDFDVNANKSSEENIPVTVYPDQITDYTRQILEHNTGEEVIMNYFDQESRQSGRHRIILLIILVFLVGISVSMVYYIRHNSYNGSSRQQTEQPYTSDIYTEAVSKDVSTQDKSIRNEEAHITTHYNRIIHEERISDQRIFGL